MEITTKRGHVVTLDDDVHLPGRLSIGSHGYAQLWNGSTVVLLHRWLLGLAIGDPRIGDHVNRNKLDNRRVNLRIVDHSGSSSNVRGRSRYPRGVSPTPRARTYYARVKHRGQVHIRTGFATPDEAAVAARELRQQHLPFATD